MLLVAGGARDPNLLAVLSAASGMGVPASSLLVSEARSPGVSWDLASGELLRDGERLDPTACFHRYDAFGSRHEFHQRSAAWHRLLVNWLAARPDVRVLNRGHLDRLTLKAVMLLRAKSAGLRVPRTILTNELGRVLEREADAPLVAKPTAGGGYCWPLTELAASTEVRDDLTASPAIVQPELSGPDVRIYVVGELAIGFRIHSRGVDYRRLGHDCIETVDSLPHDAVTGLRRLMAGEGQDWGAADFRHDPDSGELVFLELNTNPMFSAFDKVCGGAISRGLVGWLCGERVGRDRKDPSDSSLMSRRAQDGNPRTPVGGRPKRGTEIRDLLDPTP